MTQALKMDHALQPTTRGEEIRAKIEANRQRRLAIAEAMKAEAGVVSHEINKEGEGGLAYLGTGAIHSPEGRNMRQLYIVAHECGHIFLHRDAEGLRLPSHVKEMEAEMYAAQAFMAHGMTMPPELTAWGRQYVASWIVRDAQNRISIDPIVQAYADGKHSPFEPLRKVPASWLANPRIPRPLPVVPVLTVSRATPVLVTAPKASPGWRKRLWRDVCDWSAFAGRHALYGMGISNMAFSLLGHVPYLPEIQVLDPVSLAHTRAFMTFYIGMGLSWAFVASLLRTMWR